MAAVAAVILIGGSIVTVNLLNANPPQTKQSAPPTADPQDPLTAMVPAPKDVVGAPDGTGGVRFTWTNPKPQKDDKYLVTVVLLSGDGDTKVVDDPEATVAAQSGGQTCIEVQLRRADGTASSGVRGCAK